MSHYVERRCTIHGEWDMDTDNVGPCPQCPECPMCKGSGVAPASVSPTEAPEDDATLRYDATRWRQVRKWFVLLFDGPYRYVQCRIENQLIIDEILEAQRFIPSAPAASSPAAEPAEAHDIQVIHGHLMPKDGGPCIICRPAADRQAVLPNELVELIYSNPHGLMSYEDIIAVATEILAAYDLTPKGKDPAVLPTSP